MIFYILYFSLYILPQWNLIPKLFFDDLTFKFNLDTCDLIKEWN